MRLKHLVSAAGLLALVSSTSLAADQPLTLSIGAVKTEAEKEAVRLLVDYTKNLHEIFLSGTADLKKNGDATHDYIFAISPDVHIETGGKDTFDSIVAKATGNFLIFEIEPLPGDPSVIVPKSGEFFNVIPISAGIEADRNFTYCNGIAEVGYIPWYQNSKGTPDWLRQSRLGVFIQGGYKFKQTQNVTSTTSGGDEKPDEALARLKLSGSLTSPTIPIKGETGVKVIGTADGWYDMRNNEVYHRVEATLRLAFNKTTSFDFFYENGSGAPTFRKGDQFGTNLTIKY